MAVHTVAPRNWQPEGVELVERVASRCWESIERARVTKELKESEHLFRALANSIANLAWMAKPDGWIYWYNEQWYSYTGTTPGDMEGWGWERVHDPDVLPVVKERWQDAINRGVPFEMVFPLRGANGEFRRFLTRVNPVRDSRGEVAHWFGTNTDVEDERRATEANAVLRQREQLAREEAELQKRLLHSLFMQAPTLIAVLKGPDHIIELANPPICRVWAKTEEHIRNRPLFEVMPELRDQVFRSLLADVYRTGVPHIGTETPARLDRGGGRIDTVYFNFVYSPFRNVDGDIEGIFVIASQRPTERKRRVTFCAGMMCIDGIVLCADTELTRSSMKAHRSKIFVTSEHLSDFRLSIAGAGDYDFCKAAFQYTEPTLVGDDPPTLANLQSAISDGFETCTRTTFIQTSWFSATFRCWRPCGGEMRAIA